jgi:2,5-diketo-D-gluconate reductase B
MGTQLKFLESHNVKMPALGFGTWQLSGEDCVKAVRIALDIGYRHIDTAQMYNNEAEVGEAIAESKIPRADLFVTTKVWMENAASAKVKSSAAESLKKLRLDHVDLLLLHWPNKDVPLEETLGALSELRYLNKTRAIGVSNFPVALMKEAVEKLGVPVFCNQIEYHVMLSQKPVLDYARKHKIIVTAYSPLGKGELVKHPVLAAIGEKHSKSAAQIALRWLIQQDGVAAIPKSSREETIRQNFEIFDFELDAEDLQKIEQLGGNNRLINPAFAPAWDAA